MWIWVVSKMMQGWVVALRWWRIRVEDLAEQIISIMVSPWKCQSWKKQKLSENLSYPRWIQRSTNLPQLSTPAFNLMILLLPPKTRQLPNTSTENKKKTAKIPELSKVSIMEESQLKSSFKTTLKSSLKTSCLFQFLFVKQNSKNMNKEIWQSSKGIEIMKIHRQNR